MSNGTHIRLDIQGLRALAVLAVIVFHMRADWLPGGFLGVDVFFVVSGFVVSRVVLKQADGFAWLGFCAQRLRRIVPAYAAMLLLVALLAALVFIPDDFRLFEKSLRRALSFSSNRHFAGEGDYFAPAVHEWPLLHTWSLAVEMQFYLLLPFVLRGTPRRWLPTVLGLLCVAGFALAQWSLTHASDPQALYYAMSTRAPEFLMGAWLATVLTPPGVEPAWWRRPLGLLGLALMLSAFVLLDGESFSPLTSVWPCLGAMLLIAAQDERAAGRWLAHRHLVLIGALSYSLYLWHWPVLALARYVWQDSELPWPLLAACAFAFSLLAWLSWRFIERPWLRPQGMRRSTRVALVAAMAIAPLIAARPLNATVVATPPSASLRYAAPDAICHGQIKGHCQRGASSATRELLLLGDSHAAQLNLFMDAFGQAQRVRATVLSASSCVPIPGYRAQGLASWAIEPCRDMQEAVQVRLAKHDTLILAGKWSQQVSNPAFMPALEDFLQERERRLQRVLVLAQLPMLDRNPVRTRRLDALGIHLGNSVDPATREANARIEAAVQRFPHVGFVDFASLALFATVPVSDGELIYMDKHHLNETGALRYAQAAGPRLAELLFSPETPTSP